MRGHDELIKVRQELEGQWIERGVAIRLGMLAMLAGEPLLLLGPPGVGKTALAHQLHPSGLVLEEALLRARDTSLALSSRPDHAPIIGTALRWRRQASLEPLLDRFLVRLWLEPVSDAGLDALLSAPAPNSSLPWLSGPLLNGVRARAAATPLSPELLQLLHALRASLAAQGAPASDRRWRQVSAALRIAAAADDRAEASLWDGWLLPHLLARSPDQRDALKLWWEERALGPVAVDLGPVLAEVEGWERRLEDLQRRVAAALRGRGEPKSILMRVVQNAKENLPSLLSTLQRIVHPVGDALAHLDATFPAPSVFLDLAVIDARARMQAAVNSGLGERLAKLEQSVLALEPHVARVPG